MVTCTLPTYANGKMMTLKRLTLTAVLICCLGASLANAQRLAALPNDSRFDTPITLTTALGGESLGAIITAIANSVGLTPVLEDVPDDLVNYEIVDPKPFRQIWNLVLSLNGLDYQLLPNDIIVVGLTEAIGTVGERRFVAGEEIPVETRFYFTRFVEPEQIEERLNTLLSNIDTDDLLVLEDFLRATADANPQLEQAPAADDTGDGTQPAQQIFFPATPFPAPTTEPAEPQGWQEDNSAPVVMLVNDAGMFFAQATDTTMQAIATEEPTLVEQLISVTVDNDVLIVTAPEGIIDQLERIITALDAPSQRPAAPDPIVRRSYQLSNSRAEDLAEVLREALTGVQPPEEAVDQQFVEVVDEGDDRNSTFVFAPPTTTPTDDQAALVGSEQIAISADTRTNRLIVTAPLSVQDEIEGLIQDLDIPQLQVNVQVRIQQVSTDITENLGLNINSGIGNLTANFLGTEGLNFVFDAQRALSGFNIGATLDALERQGLSRSVDDATLTILNNETANFNSGGRIEAIVDQGATDELIVTPFGTRIDVTPQINSDGRIILDIAVEISDLLTPTTQFNPRVFNENRLSSTVALDPGQTVLIGGLFQSSISDTVISIPILGDIPVIGDLFRSRQFESENSELLLVVTAEVIE